jgi:hypothetical protein
MTLDTRVDALVERLTDVRATLLRRSDELVAFDARLDDVVWPCQRHEHVGAAEFDSPNTCLVAEALASRLWVSRPVLEHISSLLPEDLHGPAAEWFFLHQLVHVAQGLGYHDFRTLNRVGNRHETMRPDCDADLISLKALAWLMSTGDTRTAGTRDGNGHSAPGYVACFTYLVDVLVPEMMGMEPNLFIPRNREIEHKRMFALLLLRYYFTQAAGGSAVPDASIFPWWTEDRTSLYIFVGQVHTLGRGPIAVDPDRLSSVLERLAAGRIQAAYAELSGLDWPPLTSRSLPHRLMQSQP